MKKETYAMYGDILREELLLAMGCTEPGCRCLCRSHCPKRSGQAGKASANAELYVSGNIIKNVKASLSPTRTV